MHRLSTGQAATLALSADDLNILIARASSAGKAHTKLYFAIVDNQMAIDSSFPLSGESRGGSSSDKAFYFSGKLFCDLSFANGEFAIVGRKLETIDGQPASAFLTAIFTSPAFNQSVSRSFNDGFHHALRQNPAGEEFLTKVRTIAVQNNRVVITAADR